jgi:hypothetical protein
MMHHAVPSPVAVTSTMAAMAELLVLFLGLWRGAM